MNRHLFVRHAGFGDVLMATPLVRAIRKDAPQARLDFYSTMPWAVAGVPGVGEQIEMSEKSLDEIRDRYEAIHYLCYEHALDLHSTAIARPPECSRTTRR